VTTVRQPAKDVSTEFAQGSIRKDNSAFLMFIKQRIPILVAQPPIIALFWFCQIPLWLYPFLWIAPVYFGVSFQMRSGHFAIMPFPACRMKQSTLIG